MEIALVHDNQLLLGPIGYNVRMINGELEDLELEDRIGPQSYVDIPIRFSDGLTHLIPIEKSIPPHDPKYSNVGNFTWEIIREDDIPTKVLLSYPISDKTLDEVKSTRKQEVSPARKVKENTIISLIVNGVEVQTSTSREERLLLASKLSASPGPHNYKFSNTWLEITSSELSYIINEIDKVVQSAFDWELSKLNEIDSCETIDDVYNVIINEDERVKVRPLQRTQRNDI